MNLFGYKSQGEITEAFNKRKARKTSKRRVWSSNPALIDCNRVNRIIKAQG